MRYRGLLKWMVLALVFPMFGNAVAFVDGASRSSRSPNVVFIVVDDLGWRDLGCYGSTFYETPNMDRLAKHGNYKSTYAD